MAHLTIRLLGPFQVALDGQPVTAFESDKVRALLVYLAVESKRAHRRERLGATAEELLEELETPDR